MAGVSATDAVDGDVTADIVVSGSVDVNTVGNYDITYTVTDSDGNLASETRRVVVKGLDGCEVHQELIDGECVDIPPTEITIMHGAVYEIDPFHEDYSGTEQLERQQLQTAVEEQYNVIINYEPYPTTAAWGPTRVNAIIQSSISGDHLSDIYWVTSDWIQQLVQGDAIAPVTSYMDTYGVNIDPIFWDVGGYQGDIYGFESGQVTMSTGLYYNADLIDQLGVTNPSQMFLDGDWTWSQFETWATNVQTQLSSLGEDYFALGGMLSYYAASMVPLNGGSLINAETGRVSFAQNPAFETYDFLTTLYEKGLFESAPQYDAGSPAWQAGKVALHPGSLWFINASNRWGGIEFEIGFVPYPTADSFTGDYVSPVNGVALMTLASGMDPEREALVFEVWNALQLWKTPTEAATDFAFTLLTKFDDQLYIDAYMAVYDKVYLDLINAIGISAYDPEIGWSSRINAGIRDGNARTLMDTIRPNYEAALDDYLGN
jgi:maltose-binding protein MalE